MSQIIQIEANKKIENSIPSNDILRMAGVKRIRDGWYTVTYTGNIDRATIVSAKRNKGGEYSLIKFLEKYLLTPNSTHARV